MEGSHPRYYQKVCQENWTPPSPWQATVFNRCPGSLCIQHQAWYRIWQHCLEWPQFLRCCTLRAIKQKRCQADYKNKPFIRPISRAPSGSCRFAEPWYSPPYGPMHTDPQSLSRTPSSRWHLQRALSPWISPGKRRQSPRTSPLSIHVQHPKKSSFQRSPLFQAATTWNRFVAATASRYLPSARDISNFFYQ